MIFARFRELGSARQVLLAMRAEQIHFTRPSDGRTLVTFDWTLIRYRNVIAVLENPFYAGVYAYGKNEARTTIVESRAQKTYKHPRPREEWKVLLKEHHEGYIDWDEFERNQKQLAANAYGKTAMSSLGEVGGRCWPACLHADVVPDVCQPVIRGVPLNLSIDACVLSYPPERLNVSSLVVRV